MSVTANAQQMNFKVKDLIKILKENRIKHIAEFKEAFEGYLVKIGEVLKEETKKHKAGKDYSRGFSLSLIVPTSYEKEYTVIIEMLEHCTDDTIMLDRSSFTSYVMDEWQWKNSFTSTTSLYNSKMA